MFPPAIFGTAGRQWSPLARLLAAALLALFAACAPATSNGGDPEFQRGPRDIVVILVDTLRADRLGVYGYERPTSPVIDAFAEGAIVFDHCVSQSTWTKPSVASLMTGLLPAEHGVHRTNSPLDSRLTTAAEILKQRGYQTAGFVSNGLVSGAKHGMGQGFDVFEGHFAEDSSAPYPRAEAVVDRSIEWLEGAPDTPMFLYVHLYDPHAPYIPPQPYRGEFDRGLGGAIDGTYPVGNPGHKPEDLSPQDWEHWRDLYDAEIAYADMHVGRLLSALKQSGRFDDSLVVFLSDHGEEFFEHGDWMHNPKMYQEVVHVPLIVKPPASTELRTGVRVDTLVMQLDFIPTVLDLIGAEPIASLHGTSWLTRAWQGSGFGDARAYSEVKHHGHIRRGVFEGQWKRVRADAPMHADLLFQLEADPQERENLFDRPGTPIRRLDEVLSDFEEHGAKTNSVCIELANGTSMERRVTLRIASDPAPVGIDPVDAEYKDDSPVETRDGPLELSAEDWLGNRLTTVSIALCLPPGDTDRISVDLAAGCQEVWILVEEDATDRRPLELLYGAAMTPVKGFPLRLDLADPALLRDAPDPLDGPPESEFRGIVWLAPGGGLRPIVLTEEERSSLNDLGYVEGD